MLRKLFFAAAVSSVFAMSLPAFAACEGNSDAEYMRDLQEPIIEAMVESHMGAAARVKYCLSANRSLGASYVYLGQAGRTCRILFINVAIVGNSCDGSSGAAPHQQCEYRGDSCYSSSECCSGYCSNVAPGVGGYCY